MMNDMMPTIEETITPDIEAQIEHEEHESRQQLLLEQESWADLVAVHGPLMTDAEWKQYKYERTLALCVNAFLEEDEEEKKDFEDEIERRELTGLYKLWSDKWEADGVREMTGCDDSS